MSLELPGYRIDSLLFKSDRARIFRATKGASEERVIIKVPSEDPPSPRSVAALKRAFAIASAIESTGVVKHLELLHHGSTWALVMADTGAVALDRRLSHAGLEDLDLFFRTAIASARALADVHAARVVHKDIKPANIVANEATGLVQIIDFGIASRLDREETSAEAFRRLEGTLHYMSPEQTGRMNRSVDLRSDLYSLGATFYELLTGQPPFVSADPVELIHAHLAQSPRAPHLLRRGIPEPLSALTLRLLSKAPEDRYASAQGVARDLERIRDSWKATGTCRPFSLGQHDVSPHFRLPGGIYGRKQETSVLLGAFERVAEGRTTLLTVVGPSGMGKTALVHEVRRPITVRRGYFCGGKFEQFRRDIPYFALIQALRDLVAQVLTEPTPKIEAFQGAARAATGGAGRVLVDLLPEMTHLLGDPPPLPAVGPSEAQARFNRVILSFLRIFAQPEHPLVLFLDDLQWADAPSLALMELLATDPDTSHLLLIGGYRDNEVGAAHQLRGMLQRLQESGIDLQHLALSPLPVWAVADMLQDALGLEPTRAERAGRIIQEKTGGNPFFTLEFLRAMHDRGCVTFDAVRWLWRCDLAQVQSLAITDNVVGFLTERLQNLSPGSRELLTTASCLGAEFSLQELASVEQKTAQTTAQALEEVLLLGLLQPIGNEYKYAVELEDSDGLWKGVRYRFQHDRVQQAAYDLQSEEAQAQRHLDIGRTLLASLSPEERQSQIVSLVEHLNRGRHLIEAEGERRTLQKLNQEAGAIASSSLAFDAARRYFEIAAALLPEGAWSDDYDATLALHIRFAQVLAAQNNRDKLKEIGDLMSRKARTEQDLVPLHVILHQHEVAEGRFIEALELALGTIARFGVELPRHPGLHHVLKQVAATELAILGQSPEDILAQGPMNDPRARAVVDLMGSSASAVYFAEQNLLPIFGMTMVRLSLKHGNADWSSYGYAVYALVLTGALGRIERGYEVGKLALELGARAGGAHESRVRFVVDTFVRHWKEPPREITADLLADWASALDQGDEQTAAYCAGVAFYNDFFGGTDLQTLQARHRDATTFLERCKQEHVKDGFLAWNQLVSQLTTPGAPTDALAGELFSMEQKLPFYEAQKNGVVIALSSLAAAILDHLCERHERAQQHLERALHHEESILSQVVVPALSFLVALNGLALLLARRPVQNKVRLLLLVRNQLRRLRGWRSHAPANQRARVLLLEAMFAELEGQKGRALDLHFRAVDAAHQDGLLFEEVLACLNGQRCAERQHLQAAAADLRRRAADQMHHWGARLGEEAAPRSSVAFDLQEPPTRTTQGRGQTTRSNPSASISVNTSSAELDLLSVMKSSQAISETLVLEELMRRLLRTLLENAAAQRGFLILKGSPEFTLEAQIDAGAGEFSMHQGASETLQGIAHSMVRYVERTRDKIVLDDATREERFHKDPHLQTARPRSVLCMPILRQQRLVGVLYLENNLTAHAFTEARCRLLELLSVQAAISLENARLYDNMESNVRERTQQLKESVDRLEKTQAALDAELHDAAAYVLSLLPAPIHQENLRVDWRYVPSAHLGGDVLGYTWIDEHRLAFYILDVAGHGISSALLSISILSALQTRRLGNADLADPPSVLRALNEAFHQGNNGGKHFTMWYGVLDLRTRELVCANGGHPSAVIIDPDGHRRELGGTGVMLGVITDHSFPAETTTLRPGERLFVFSDGAYEIITPQGDMLPQEAFSQRLTRAALQDPAPVEAMLHFACATRGGPLEDDFTMLSLELPL